jgi:hypothetical protein
MDRIWPCIDTPDMIDSIRVAAANAPIRFDPVRRWWWIGRIGRNGDTPRGELSGVSGRQTDSELRVEEVELPTIATFCTGMASEYLGNLKGAKLKVE